MIKNLKKMEQSMFVKEQRILYWQKYNKLPSISDLIDEHKKLIRDLEKQN